VSGAASPAVEVRGARKDFFAGRRLLGAGVRVRAVDGVSFAVPPGRVLGIAGESGSGKSTLANLLVGLEQPSDGEILVAGGALGRRPDAAFRRSVQMVFQDPFGSINPRFTIGRTVAEPLLIHRIGEEAERRRRAAEALDEAELRPGAAFLDRYPHELSGGQRQRVAIARAIVLRPRLLVADEPVSMLDVSVRAGILRLLKRLVAEGEMAMVFITHDLSIVASVCDELAVMYRGVFVEHGPVMEVLRRAVHPYTRALIAAVPVPDPGVRPAPPPAKLLAGGGAETGPGCRFAPRCEHARDACSGREPAMEDVAPGHRAACLRATELMGGP
jgi:oligopeptide/dipeptide ABC transporter ATP-binding protein